MMSTAAAPSVICDELAAVITPSGLNAGFSLASFSTFESGRMPSSTLTTRLAVLALDRDRNDLPVEAALFASRAPHACATRRRTRRSPRARCPTSRRSARPRCPAARGSGSASVISGPNGKPYLPSATDAPIGTRVMFSTPAAMTTSYAPAITPCAAKCAACCDEPHWRSTVVPGTDSGNPAASAALRAMLMPCSPTCMTQPMITSSTSAGSRPLRSTIVADHVRGEVDGVDVLELAVAASERRADCVDDDGRRH